MPRRATILWASAAVWFVIAILSAVQTWLAMITHGHSLPRMLFYHLAIWMVWVLMTPLVFRLARRFPVVPFRMRNALLHFLFALVAGIVHGSIWLTLTIVIRPYDAMTVQEFGPAFPFVTFARLPSEILIYAAILGVSYAAESWERAAQLERSLVDARLHALELQIQPHFLFNTLNAISGLVRGRQNDEAVQVIAGLSDLLRYTLDHAGSQRVALDQEAAILKRYLEIQQVRFSDRLEISIEIGEDAARAAVPTLLLQPLAENAVRHGIAQFAGPARIDVRAFRDRDQLRIEMFNSGTLRSPATFGIGLRNTIERLQQLYPATHAFALQNSNGGVLATIAIPWSEIA
jgi:two-component system, LytTR family, sensor kinase